MGYFDKNGTWQRFGEDPRGPAPVITTKKGKKKPVDLPVFERFWDPSPAHEEILPVELWSTWDTAQLAEQRVPGVVRVRTRKHRRAIAPTAIGGQAVPIADLGASASMVEFQCRLWTEQHLAQYTVLAKAIQTVGGGLSAVASGKASAVQAYHPALTLLGIRHLYVTTVGAPESNSAGGVWTATIEAQEYKPMPKGVKDGKALAVDRSAGTGQAKLAPKFESPASTEAKAR